MDREDNFSFAFSCARPSVLPPLQIYSAPGISATMSYLERRYEERRDGILTLVPGVLFGSLR